jgi:hypothetical protein
MYIDPFVNYGLDNALPEDIRSRLRMEAGYDRWEQSPTLVMDYLSPIVERSSEGLFFNPRVSYYDNKGNVALGASIRRMWNDRLFIGLNAWHDWKDLDSGSSPPLRQVTAGIEVSALPGRHSDLVFSANLYLPANKVTEYDHQKSAMLSSQISKGVDASLSYKLPAMSQYIDAGLSGGMSAFERAQSNSLGYNGGFNISSRDGLAAMRADYSYEGSTEIGEETISLSAEINMVFDWAAALRGENPFSAPYTVSTERFNRDISTNVKQRAARLYNVPVNVVEKPIALSASVNGNEVAFQAGFPELPDSEFMVQTSQSPWLDRGVIRSDGSGFCKGSIALAPGTYLLRLKHLSTSKITRPIEIVIGPEH